MDGRRRRRQRRRVSVECDPSCRMAAALLGAQCEYETLIVTATKQHTEPWEKSTKSTRKKIPLVPRYILQTYHEI